MTIEVRWRNPQGYLDTVYATGHAEMVFDAALIKAGDLSPPNYFSLYAPTGTRWDAWVASRRGVQAYRWDRSDPLVPYAVYPSWAYGDPIIELEEMMAANVADDDDATTDESVPEDLRPVPGQRHLVFVYGLPALNTGEGRRFRRILRDITEEHSDATLHVYGLETYNLMFSSGFKSVDWDPTYIRKWITLPNGRTTSPEAAAGHAKWILPFGFMPTELEDQDRRFLFNAKGCLWAAENFNSEVRIKFAKRGDVDPDLPLAVATATPIASDKTPIYHGTPKDGDKVTCDTCSLAPSCKYYRIEAVCSMPSTEGNQLAKQFRTRDSSTIIDGLAELLSIQTERLQRGLRYEEEMDELSPEVTKIVDGLFDKGLKLAKVVDPTLSPGPRIGVFVGGAGGPMAVAPHINAGQGKRVVARVVAELEAAGVPRDRITPQMIENALNPDPKIIETTAIEANHT
jgi:hypothetical protein